MRRAFCILFSALPLAAFAAPFDYTVHEWGTFTSIVGSDGVPLSGLEIEEEPLPPFVYSIEGIVPHNKGFNRPLTGVTIKMETPVMYFYSGAKDSFPVSVDVTFQGGSISQWYPNVSKTEKLPEPRVLGADAPLLDFSYPHKGFSNWDLTVFPHNAGVKPTAPKAAETPQWPRARIAAANMIQGSAGEIENFLFYRGIGHFSLPLRIIAEKGGMLRLSNLGTDPIPFVLVYKKEQANSPSMSWTCTLAGGETQLSGKLIHADISLNQALLSAGLTLEEAQALSTTWKESYFDRPGLRVFWIVPRTLTDKILPLKLTPKPAHLERVLVGRTEVLTPEFESTLLQDYAQGKAKRWAESRYAKSYQERVQTLNQIAFDAWRSQQ